MKTILNFVYVHVCKPNQKIEKNDTRADYFFIEYIERKRAGCPE